MVGSTGARGTALGSTCTRAAFHHLLSASFNTLLHGPLLTTVVTLSLFSSLRRKVPTSSLPTARLIGAVSQEAGCVMRWTNSPAHSFLWPALADVRRSPGGRNRGSCLPPEKHHSISKEGMFMILSTGNFFFFSSLLLVSFKENPACLY